MDQISRKSLNLSKSLHDRLSLIPMSPKSATACRCRCGLPARRDAWPACSTDFLVRIDCASLPPPAPSDRSPDRLCGPVPGRRRCQPDPLMKKLLSTRLPIATRLALLGVFFVGVAVAASVMVSLRAAGLAAAAAGLLPADDIVMTATLSKALAAQGGVVMGSQAVIDHLIDAARPVIFDTALAPPSVAAALAALRIVITEPDLPNRARANAAHLAELATSMGLTVTPPDAAVVGITIGSAQDAVQARDICAEHGVRVGCFRPPSVPDGQSLLRLTARANLSEPDLARTAAALAAVARSLTGSS